MNIHLIAIGGAVMHNLAIALHLKGHTVTGSDDEIFEPSKSRLMKYGLLPDKVGWDTSRIHDQLDLVVLGMHAKKDNPELIKAQESGVTIQSFPEYFYQQNKDKKRIVICGSHGKTTITSMIMHVFKDNGMRFNYLVGSKTEGFETMVGLDDNAEWAIIEGDEYLSSPLDPRPKFHHYYPHITLISGVAWDHFNVFPTLEGYLGVFSRLIDLIEPNGTLIYDETDHELDAIISENPRKIEYIPYQEHMHDIKNGITCLYHENLEYPLKIFGSHNMKNISGALEVCEKTGIARVQFYESISRFKGAAKRLQQIAGKGNFRAFIDFAHSPSKLKATAEALKEQFPDQKLLVIYELHTYSSLNQQYLPEYYHTLNAADEAFVYFNPENVHRKKLGKLKQKKVIESFGREDMLVFTDMELLEQSLLSRSLKNTTVAFMSSGDFGGMNVLRVVGKMETAVKK